MHNLDLNSCDVCSFLNRYVCYTSKGLYVFFDRVYIKLKVIYGDNMQKIKHLVKDTGLAYTTYSSIAAIFIMRHMLNAHPHLPPLMTAMEKVSYGLLPMVEDNPIFNNIEVIRPQGLKLFSFQEKAARAVAGIIEAKISGRSRQNGILVADEMGLGKTITAACVINSAPSVNKVVVVCPAIMVNKFAYEFDKWITKDMEIIPLTRWTIGKYMRRVSNFDNDDRFVIITNYDYVTKSLAILNKDISIDLLIADEAHYLKNERTRRSRAILGTFYGGKLKHKPLISYKSCLFLTGTPATNEIKDIFPLLRAMDPNAWNKDEFMHRYCGYGLELVYARNKIRRKVLKKVIDPSDEVIEELTARLRSSYMIRRLKRDVLTDLPSKIRETLKLDADHKFIEILSKEKAIIENAAEMLPQLEGKEKAKFTIETLKELSENRMHLAIAKAPYVVEMAKHVLSNGKNPIVFCHHRKVAETLSSMLSADFIDGSIKPQDRKAVIDAYLDNIKKNGPSALIVTIYSCGIGIDLTMSDTAIFAEIDWVPATIIQAEDRLHRIGQSSNVQYYYIVVPGSIEERIAQMVVEKSERIKSALGDKVNEFAFLDDGDSSKNLLEFLIHAYIGRGNENKIKEIQGQEIAS